MWKPIRTSGLLQIQQPFAELSVLGPSVASNADEPRNPKFDTPDLVPSFETSKRALRRRGRREGVLLDALATREAEAERPLRVP